MISFELGNEIQSFKYEYYNLKSNLNNENSNIQTLFSRKINKPILTNEFYWIIYDDFNNLIIKKTEILNDSYNLFAGPFNTENELNEFLFNIKNLNYEIKYEE